MSDYLTEGWPLSPTSTIYMDGTAVYGVRRYGIPGATNVVLRCEHADLIREVVAERIQQAKAEAWDEGFDAGHETARFVQPGYPATPANPYGEQEGAEQPSSRLSCDICGNLKDTPLHEHGCPVGRKEYGHE